MDKRKEANLRVKKAITDSLFQMMEGRPLSEITITEIIKTSGVARVSFYRNYSSKEDVLITLVRDILDEFRETADYDLSDVYSTHHLKRVIEYFIKNRSYVLNLYHSGYGTMLLNELNLFHESIAGNMPASSETRYKLYIYMGAIYNASIIYLSEESPKPVDDLVRVLSSALRP